MKEKIIILGGGLAGISAAYHLNPQQFNVTLFEKSNVIGGTAGSIKVQGFTFDFSLHLLHLHNEYTKKLINTLLKDNLYTCERKAAIFIYDKLIPYPFQVHTYGLPSDVIKDCVEGFREAVDKFSDPALRSTSLPFGEWSLRTFGSGITQHFMKPYNEKLWQTNVTDMTAEWCGMFVPQPKLEEVEEGALRPKTKEFGYNTIFLYPKKGGIQVLSQALAKGLDIKLNSPLEELNWKEKTITVLGEKKFYDSLVTSIPLPELLKRMKNLPNEIEALIPKLRWTSVICTNLGIDRAAISDKSWIYFPEKKYIFYRVGFPMNFTPYAVPEGCSSMYVEISSPADKPIDWQKPEFLEKIHSDLVLATILRPEDKIIVSNFVSIYYGYVLFTFDYRNTIDKIFTFLRSQNIFCIGRYGEWKYSYMEEAILDGKKIAEALSKKHAKKNSELLLAEHVTV